MDIDTAGANSAPLAADRGGGTITATGGTVASSGSDSPSLYSTGTISVTGGTYTSTGAEAAVIDGGNTITLTDTSLSSSMEKWGVMIYQSMSGDAEGTRGTFTMSGGALSYTVASGPLFYVTNSTGIITLKRVAISDRSNVLVKAAAGNWGNSGANGGTVDLTADSQVLTGDILTDSLSSVSLTLRNGSSLSGAINADRAAKSTALTLDASSTWSVTADSYLTTITLGNGVSGEFIFTSTATATRSTTTAARTRPWAVGPIRSPVAACSSRRVSVTPQGS